MNIALYIYFTGVLISYIIIRNEDDLKGRDWDSLFCRVYFYLLSWVTVIFKIIEIIKNTNIKPPKWL